MQKLYIDLLKNTLTGLNRIDKPVYEPMSWRRENKKEDSAFVKELSRLSMKNGLTLCHKTTSNINIRQHGGDWPLYAETMIGLQRLNNIEFCFNEIIKNNIPGDFIETGAWRGGSTIFMRALLKAGNINNRNVWVADSFEGLPKPSGKYKADINDKHHVFEELIISLEEVKQNFKNYQLLDDQVKFLKGLFCDTLPSAPIEKLALLRLDGDMYESTIDALVHLYPKLAIGGYIIIDDWGAVKACKQAVMDYRSRHYITEEIIEIDWTGVYWQKLK
jgi:hypothetical protein